MSPCELGKQRFIGVLLLLHCKDDASNTIASSLLNVFVEPVQHSTLQAGTVHPPKVMSAEGFNIGSLSNQNPSASPSDVWIVELMTIVDQQRWLIPVVILLPPCQGVDGSNPL